jgi:hypothetical protein
VIVLCIVVVNPIYLGTKWIPVKHLKSGEQVRVNLGTVCGLPQKFYFDAKVHSNSMRVDKLFKLTSGFGFMYPVLAGVFFNSSVLVQAFLVPIFFILRSWYEYAADSLTANTFGSDAMPVVSVAGTLFHCFPYST